MQTFKPGRPAAGTTSSAQQHQASMLNFLGKPTPSESLSSTVQSVVTSSTSRLGWEEEFKLMHENGDDQFIMDEFFPEDIDRLKELYGDNPITF